MSTCHFGPCLTRNCSPTNVVTLSKCVAPDFMTVCVDFLLLVVGS